MPYDWQNQKTEQKPNAEPPDTEKKELRRELQEERERSNKMQGWLIILGILVAFFVILPLLCDILESLGVPEPK